MRSRVAPASSPRASMSSGAVQRPELDRLEAASTSNIDRTAGDAAGRNRRARCKPAAADSSSPVTRATIDCWSATRLCSVGTPRQIGAVTRPDEAVRVLTSSSSRSSAIPASVMPAKMRPSIARVRAPSGRRTRSHALARCSAWRISPFCSAIQALQARHTNDVRHRMTGRFALGRGEHFCRGVSVAEQADGRGRATSAVPTECPPAALPTLAFIAARIRTSASSGCPRAQIMFCPDALQPHQRRRRRVGVSLLDLVEPPNRIVRIHRRDRGDEELEHLIGVADDEFAAVLDRATPAPPSSKSPDRRRSSIGRVSA